LLNNPRDFSFLLFKIALILLIFAIPYSRALISISTGMLAIAALSELILNKPVANFKNKYFLCLTALVIYCLIDGLRANSVSEWASMFGIKLPLFIFPAVVLIFKEKITPAFIKTWSVFFCISISSATLGSMINYWMNYAEINVLVLQSKNVPIIGGMHHITFSVYCAFAVFVSSYLALNWKIKWAWILAFINILGLHIITARTGLVGFYFACGILGLIYIINNKPDPKYLLLAVTMVVILPLAAYQFIGSFHNRVLNTIEDIKVIRDQKDANYQSMGMRIEATKTAFRIVKKHPLIGVGFSNLSEEMYAQYEEDKSILYKENQILPHDQFIMEAAVHGIVGLVIIILFYLFPVFSNFNKLSPLFISLWALLFFASFFECLFNRQHGVILVSLFWFMYYDHKPVKNQQS